MAGAVYSLAPFRPKEPCMFRKFSSIGALSLALVISSSVACFAESKEPAPSPPEGTEALMAYPKKVRQAALEVSLHPHLLTEVKAIQNKATKQLKDLIKQEPLDIQKQIYRVIRFPVLVMELTAGGPKSAAQVRSIVKTYPKEIQGSAIQVTKNHYDLLKQVYEINQKSNRQFEGLIQAYPAETRQAFLTLLQHPVALDILARNPNYSYLMGKKYAEGSKPAAGRLKEVKETARTKDVAAAKRSQQELRLDPQAKMLDAAAKDFVAKADRPLSEVMDPKKAAQMNVNYVPYPYPVADELPSFGADPYWYGYPDWGPADWWWY